jgi:hypothetical protein
MKSIKKHISSIRTHNTTAVVAVLVVAVAGVHLLVSSHAQTQYVATNAASGTLTGPASVQFNSTASGGTNVQFGCSQTGTDTANDSDAGSGSTINSAPTGPAAPTSGWHVDLADDFNAPLGKASGQDNLWYPNQSWNPNPAANVQGDNGTESQEYNSSQVNVDNGNLALTAKYCNDVAPATGDGSGSNSANFVQRNYVSGIVTTNPSAMGYNDFTWTPGDGSTWAFEIDCQWPLNSNDLWSGFWAVTQPEDVNERDFIEAHAAQSQFDTDWIYQTGHTIGYKADWYLDTLAFDPAASMHRYTYVVYPNQSWSLYIDGVLQTWVGKNGIGPVETSTNTPLELQIQYALRGSSIPDTFTSGTRQFLINSAAVYQDKANAGTGDTTGGGIAPGTTVAGS